MTYPCKRCGSREPRHRISLECKVTKRAIGDRVISQVGSQAGDRAGTIVRGYGKSGEYLVRWDERFGTPRESNNSSGWLDREGVGLGEAQTPHEAAANAALNLDARKVTP